MVKPLCSKSQKTSGQQGGAQGPEYLLYKKSEIKALKKIKSRKLEAFVDRVKYAKSSEKGAHGQIEDLNAVLRTKNYFSLMI